MDELWNYDKWMGRDERRGLRGNAESMTQNNQESRREEIG
jgi:hypothetical protein